MLNEKLSIAEDLRDRIRAAADPLSRRLVVRVRPPAAGVAAWLERSVAEVPAPWDAEAGLEMASRPFQALQSGDVVVAGDDGSLVLAAGVVTEPPQLVREGANLYRAGVSWWTEGLPRVVRPDPRWQLFDVCELSRTFVTSLLVKPTSIVHQEVPFDQVVRSIKGAGMRLPEEVVRRYHAALKSRGFVILAGISGTGKTWLAELYARAVGARHIVVPVAPNWTSNEDLLGYLNPLDGVFHATAFTAFLEEAAREHREAQEAGHPSRQYHLVLDEMNLARVEHYFAKFLSTMELRSRSDTGTAAVDLAPGHVAVLPPNLKVVGTVNIDETTHGFADKVYDRAQLIELDSPREALEAHLGDAPHASLLMRAWDAVAAVAPFAFRVVDDITGYIAVCTSLGTPWQDALDDQVLQKILPKVKGNDGRVGDSLARLIDVCGDTLPRSRARAQAMLQDYRDHGFASFF